MTENINKLAKNIKLLILDVDGVLTSSQIVYDNSGNELKFFNVKDGIAIKHLQQSGVKVAIISARESLAVTKRAEELQIKFLYQNQSTKTAAYKELISLLNLDHSAVAYLGDDWTDLPILLQVGLPAVVNDAEPLLIPHAKYVTQQKGGAAAARELIYLIMQAQNTFDMIVKKYYETTN
ncbi:MAG: HAD-IIIA family hydrolase [Gammaproteobacteria bacterium]|nr:HAD-IIIA family hydrolase [Gammaproteobacteria bacterium]